MKNKILLLSLLFASQIAWAGCTSRMSTATEGDTVVSTNTVVVCSDGQAEIPIKKSVHIGDQVFENELEKVTDVKPAYFTYKYSKCRLFRERVMIRNRLEVLHGVICKIDKDSEFWQVVDKW